MLHDFIEAVCAEFIPLDADNYEDDCQEYVETPKKEYEPRKAIPFEEAVLEMKTKVKAIDEKQLAYLLKESCYQLIKDIWSKRKKRNFDHFCVLINSQSISYYLKSLFLNNIILISGKQKRDLRANWKTVSFKISFLSY